MQIAVLGIKALPATAGADRVVEKLLHHFSGENEYYVYLIRSNNPKPQFGANVHYVSMPCLKGKHLRAFSFFLLCSLHVLFSRKYDLAHVHNSDFGLFCLLLRLAPRVKLVGTFHGDPYRREKWGRAARAYLRLSERAFAHCCHVLTSVSRRNVEMHKEVIVIPNGIDDCEMVRSGDKFPYAQFDLVKDQYLLFACGRLDRTKGLHHLLDAFEKSDFGSRLLVVGDFSHDRKYAEMIEARALVLPGIVLYKSLLPEATLKEVIQHCRVFVFPSEVEAMSMMLLEAISCKKIVVCSDIAENVDVVGRDFPYTFSFQQPDDLARKLWLAVSSDQKERIGLDLYHRCASQFDWRKIAARYVSLYQEVTLSYQAQTS